MNPDAVIKTLHPLEVKALYAAQEGKAFHAQDLVDALEWKTGQANQAISWLAGKDCLREVNRITKVYFELTDLGRDYLSQGTPLERILTHLEQKGPASLPELAQALSLENKDVGSAFGSLSKQGAVKMNAQKQAEYVSREKAQDLIPIRAILDKAGTAPQGILMEDQLDPQERTTMDGLAKKRGASSAPFKMVEREIVSYEITPTGLQLQAALSKAGITGEELGGLTTAMLKTGSWKKGSFRPYNISLPPGRIAMGRRNPYCEYLDWVKDKLVGLGFEEFDGPLVETEFWNSDALFMPQFHSARDIHDVYYVNEPRSAREIEQPFLDNVAAAHENGGQTGSRGWQYGFDREFTKRLILRSQGTVMSAKTLQRAQVPGKYFGVLRCFRYDQVDATHLSDFYQTEGIVLGDDVNLKNLLGLLKMFAEQIAGATEVKYVPGYFPFTEPSVEVHIKHPVLGWFELGGAGIFRPEVTKPMGVDVPVLAWGLGIDRMALMHLGLNDLRELFTPNIEHVRLRRKQ